MLFRETPAAIMPFAHASSAGRRSSLSATAASSPKWRRTTASYALTV